MNILVTGAAGFIGSHVSEALIGAGHTVIGIDNFDPFYGKEIKLRNLTGLLASDSFTFHEADLLDVEKLRAIFAESGINAVIHLAAKAGVRPSIADVKGYYDANITATINLLELMREHNIKKMAFASSSSVYGNTSMVPFSESDVAASPISPYASTKRSGELLCHVYCDLHKFDITCLRFFTVYGPRQRPDLAIHKFTRLIDQGKAIPFFGDGQTARDYTFIEDIVDGVVRSLHNLGGFRIYNLGESKIITLDDMIATIERALGKTAILDKQPMQPGDVQKTYADVSKAKNEIGYNPKYSFEDGIQRFVEWYREIRDGRSEALPATAKATDVLIH